MSERLADSIWPWSAVVKTVIEGEKTWDQLHLTPNLASSLSVLGSCTDLPECLPDKREPGHF